jgi:hypothetical protein
MKKSCGAKGKHSGLPCKAPAMENGRCRVHGGSSTGPKENHADISGNQYAKIHGIYGSCLTDEERQDAALVEIGNLDVLIRLANIQLQRALKAKNAAQSRPELEEVIISENGQTHKQRVIDYDTKIDKCMARIGSLEMQRKALMESSDADVNITIEGGFIATKRVTKS